ncbi:Ig-like domain-containing protein [Mycoplasmopsis cynos]|nr:Ig-like domain-containing protein [Mycoplasmopsis cynos]
MILEASSTGLSSTSINLISSKNENTNIIPLGFENNNYVVLKNNELKLPKKLKVVYSDGKINETDVVLDSANVKTSTPGTYPIKVKVDGVELIFNVRIIDFEQTYYVEEIFNTIGVNDPIKLPQKVTLYSKFGSILEDVVWEDISKISTEKVTKKGGEVKIKGHLAKKHPQKEVNAYIRIIHKYEIYDINKQYVQIGKTTANASYQQGNDFAQNAIDGKIDHGKRWTNWSNSNNANDQKNDFTITLDQPQDVQAIGIHFFSDRNTHKDG